MKDIVKETLSHYIDLEFYANSILEDITILYEALLEDCDKIIELQKSYNSKDSYSSAMKLVKDKINEFTSMVYDRLEKEAETVKEQETDFLKKLYGFTIGTIALSRLLFAPIDNRDTLKAFIDRTNKNLYRTYDNAMRSGYLFGSTSSDIETQIKNNVKQVSNGIASGVQTAIPSFAKTTDRIVFLQQSIEVTYCATLDGSTCVVCGSMHGLRYPSIAKAPSLPVHDRCRCVLLPSNKITEELPTYQQFIDGLSEDEQKHILGKARYEYYKSGVPLDKFVNNGTKLTLEELKERLGEDTD